MEQKNLGTKDFIQDDYFEKGNIKLKVRETVVVVLLWLILLYPILAIINSYSPFPLWKFIYHFSSKESEAFTDYCGTVLVLGFGLMTLCSTFFLLKNNHNEKYGFEKETLYDVEKCAAREVLLDEVYEKRFGTRNFRENAQFYVVAPEQNLPNGYIEGKFKKRGLEIK